jgi:hypothetical protein
MLRLLAQADDDPARTCTSASLGRPPDDNLRDGGGLLIGHF